jgi:GGDEF domain-containing protein
VLTEVARHLAAQGVAGRLGGDEFALWVPGLPGRDADSLSVVLSRAGEALYEAKRAGRGRAVRY